MDNELKDKITRDIENGTASVMNIQQIESLLKEQCSSIAQMKDPFILATVFIETTKGVKVVSEVRFTNLIGELESKYTFLEGMESYPIETLRFYNPSFFHDLTDLNNQKDNTRKDLIASLTEKYLKHNEKPKEEITKLGRGLKEVDVYVDGQHTSIKMP